MTEVEELCEQVATANQAIVDAGLVILTFGNVSAIDSARGLVAIKPSGIPCDSLERDAIVVVDLENGTTVRGTNRPSSDTPTHLALYRAWREVGAIAHTHSPRATAWAQSGRELPCLGTTHADHFRGAIPTTQPLKPDQVNARYEAATGDAIVDAFASRGASPVETPAVLVVSHGPFTWGGNVAEAVENAIALEAVASMAFETLALAPDAGEIPPHLLERHYTRKHGPDAYYGQDP